MANEKKNVTANEQETTEQVVEKQKTCLYVEREMFTAKDKREMYGYFVRGQIRGREVKVDFNAKDQGGYETLDLIFDINPKAELLIHDETMTDDKGNVTKYRVYEVQNVDELGIVYKYKVKPARDSDITYLNVLLQMLERQNATAQQ